MTSKLKTERGEEGLRDELGNDREAIVRLQLHPRACGRERF